MSDLCPVQRHKRIETASVNFVTGERKVLCVEWRTEPCGVPLFGKERERGICDCCAAGWETETSQIVDHDYQHLRKGVLKYGKQ